jgi:hypothetical protein
MNNYINIENGNRDFVENCFQIIVDNEGLPVIPQYNLNQLIYDFDYSDSDFLSKIVYAYIELAGIESDDIHSDFELVIDKYELDNFPFITLPNLLDINLVHLTFVDGQLQKITILYNKQFHQIILCELAILLPNSFRSFPSANSLNETLSEINAYHIIYSVFQGFGLLLLYFNETMIKISSREHYYDIPIFYHLNNDEISYSIALWYTMFHYEYNLQGCMQEYFPKNYFNSISKMIDYLNESDVFYCERVLKSALFFEASNHYWQCNFKQAIIYLKSPEIEIGIEEYKKADIFVLIAQNYLALCDLSNAKIYFEKAKIPKEDSLIIPGLYLLFIDLIESSKYDRETFVKYRSILENQIENEFNLTVEPVLLELIESMIIKIDGYIELPLLWDEIYLNVTVAVLYKHYLAFWNGEKLNELGTIIETR